MKKRRLVIFFFLLAIVLVFSYISMKWLAFQERVAQKQIEIEVLRSRIRHQALIAQQTALEKEKKGDLPHIRVYIPRKVLDALLDGFEGIRIRIPKKDLEIELQELTLHFSRALVHVRIQARIRMMRRGLSFPVEGYAYLVLTEVQEPKPGLLARIIFYDLLPHLPFQRRLVKGASFFHALSKIHVDDINRAIPSLRIPIRLDIPFRVKPSSHSFHIRVPGGQLRGTVRFPGFAFPFHLKLKRVFIWKGGLEIGLSVPDFSMPKANVRRIGGPYRSGEEKNTSEVSLYLSNRLLYSLIEYANHLPIQKRTIRFEFSQGEGYLFESPKGALGCGYWVQLSQEPFLSRIQVLHIDPPEFLHQSLTTRVRVDIRGEGRLKGHVRAPACPFSSCTKCTLGSGISLATKVRLKKVDRFKGRLQFRLDQEGWMDYIIDFPEEKRLSFHIIIKVPVLKNKEFDVPITLPARTLHRGKFPALFEEQGRFSLLRSSIIHHDSRMIDFKIRARSVMWGPEALVVKMQLNIRWLTQTK